MRSWMFLAVLGITGWGCSGAVPTEPDNPLAQDATGELLQAINRLGIAGGDLQSLPIVFGSIQGPGGTPINVAALEFVQQLTTSTGEVLRASGVSLIGVSTTSSTPYDWVHAGIVQTGTDAALATNVSLPMTGPPSSEFSLVAVEAFGGLRDRATGVFHWSSSGSFTFSSSSFGATSPCALDVTGGLQVTSCTIQTGQVTGSVEFLVSLGGGDVVQAPVNFTVPAIRQVIVVEEL